MAKNEENKEACGRCAMSSVSGVMDEEYDPFDGERIEVPEDEVRKVSPGVILGRVKRRIDSVVTRLTYGR
ncbi:hypothetical protein [Halovenus salina]|uniref:Uncharacterized protein n=1 Tax=Halovenus salina TaxID=1510225 RepID=A0ABD5VYM2_9EURY|nr:hypothetical protein [Halovenus salina]